MGRKFASDVERQNLAAIARSGRVEEAQVTALIKQLVHENPSSDPHHLQKILAPMLPEAFFRLYKVLRKGKDKDALNAVKEVFQWTYKVPIDTAFEVAKLDILRKYASADRLRAIASLRTPRQIEAALTELQTEYEAIEGNKEDEDGNTVNH